MSTSETNKQIVLDYFDLAYVQKRPSQATERFLGSSYVQHDPRTPDGVEPFMSAADGTPVDATAEVKRVIAEGDMVVLHAHLRDFDPASLDLEDEMDRERGMAVMHVYRVQDERIVEHWDVYQAVPETPANDNTMF